MIAKNVFRSDYQYGALRSLLNKPGKAKVATINLKVSFMSWSI